MHRTALSEESKLKAWIATTALLTVGIVAAAPAATDESEFFNLLDSQYLRQHYIRLSFIESQGG
jgi:hypothetical protein